MQLYCVSRWNVYCKNDTRPLQCQVHYIQFHFLLGWQHLVRAEFKTQNPKFWDLPHHETGKSYLCTLSVVYLASFYQQQMLCSEKLVGVMNWKGYGRFLVKRLVLSLFPSVHWLLQICGKERNPCVAMGQISSVLYQDILSSLVPFMHRHRFIRWNITKNEWGGGTCFLLFIQNSNH